MAKISLDVQNEGEETYSAYPPTIIVGNLFIGERFIEPQGPCKIVNETNGFSCTMEFNPRESQFGLINRKKGNKVNHMTATIKDANDKVHYRIEGNYYEKLDLINEETG